MADDHDPAEPGAESPEDSAEGQTLDLAIEQELARRLKEIRARLRQGKKEE